MMALALAGCGASGIRGLKDPMILVYPDPITQPFGTKQIRVSLAYDARHCAGKLTSHLAAKFNGRSMTVLTRGSPPHWKLGEFGFPAHESCHTPAFAITTVAADETVSVSTVEITDGRRSMTAEFDDLYLPRTLEIETELRAGQRASARWSPAHDRFVRIVDSAVVAESPFLYFHYDGAPRNPSDRRQDDPADWNTSNRAATVDSRIDFIVPSDASTGPGILTVQENMSGSIWNEARRCDGAVRCFAEPATTKAEARAPVVGAALTRTIISEAKQIESRSGATATRLGDGRVLLAGGTRINAYLASAEIWDPQTRTWTATSPMRRTRSYHGAIALPGNRVLVVGGSSYDGFADPKAECGARGTAERSEIWEAGRWSFAGCLPAGFEARTGLAPIALADGRIVVATEGAPKEGETQAPPSGLVVFDPEKRTWSELTHFPARTDYGLALLPDGRILIIGGTIPGKEPTTEVLVFDPRPRQWSTAPSLSSSRHRFSTAMLPDGRIFIAGGTTENARGDLMNNQTSEIFDPHANAWTRGPTFRQDTPPATAAALSDGRVVAIAKQQAYVWRDGETSWTPIAEVVWRDAYYSMVPYPDGTLLLAGGQQNGGISETLRLPP